MPSRRIGKPAYATHLNLGVYRRTLSAVSTTSRCSGALTYSPIMGAMNAAEREKVLSV